MRRTTLDAHRARIERVTHHLATQLDDEIDTAALARMAALSPRQLERVFTRTLGQTPRAYLRRLRLERASVRLQKTRASVLTVAVEAGFQSHEAFTRVFRQRFGHTPAAYRRLGSTSAQPRARAKLWQHIAASGLRAYVESGTRGMSS